MVTQVTLTLITIALCMQSSLGQTIFYWGRNAAYNALCPTNITEENKHKPVAMPPEECDVVSFITCDNGSAIATTRCGEGYRFDQVSGWCVQADRVPLPPNCEVDTAFQAPRTCAEGATFLPVENTCKNYSFCLPDGRALEMPCNYGFYYIHNAQRCVLPARVTSDQKEALQECQNIDPYPIDASSSK